MISSIPNVKHKRSLSSLTFVGLAYQGKDIVFRFIIEYSRLRDFGFFCRISLKIIFLHGEIFDFS
jgi:hypothetical protein